jgi:hypothetical protein
MAGRRKVSPTQKLKLRREAVATEDYRPPLLYPVVQVHTHDLIGLLDEIAELKAKNANLRNRKAKWQ